MKKRMPAIFFGHGNPMNALEDNPYSRGWASIGKALPRPEAILCISAHWYVPGTSITANIAPPTIHDFGGFPEALYEMRYNAPGSTKLIQQVSDVLDFIPPALEHGWGLDHGAWSVLCHVFPDADVPVAQLSIDRTRPAAFHYELGKKLAALRDEGVLIMGSGNLVHNLHAYAWGKPDAKPFDWAQRFETQAKALMESGQHDTLLHYETLGSDAMLSIPTPEHFLPLAYVLGTQREGEKISFPIEGIEGGSVSMLTVQVG
jgi:4,5-DOPA dioxygenase extradiol